jgi:hypothetical protein
MNIITALDEISGAELLFQAALAALVLGLWIRAVLGVRIEWPLLVCAAVNGLLLIWLKQDNSFWLARDGGPWSDQSRFLQMRSIIFGSFFAANLGWALMVKVYRAMVLGKMREAEQATGVIGVRAWLAPMNAVSVLALAVTADIAFDWNFFGMFLLGVCLLLMYPLIGSVSQTGETAPLPAAAPEERQRVLALVEIGKISAEDGAELLSALAQSQAAGIESERAIPRSRRLMILGGIILLIGFFLPWFTLNLTQAVSQMASEVQQAMPQMPVPGVPPAVNLNATAQIPQLAGVSVLTLRGGDVRNGLGWISLAAGLLAAMLPFFWSERAGDSKSLRNITFASLGIGSVAMLYLLSNSFNSVTTIEAGFYLALVGFVLLWIGGVREYVAIHPRLHATLTTA